ncbi:hypothetical protein VTL71DRAFT_16251, partial [Oculimacula yallundae]
MEIKTKLISWRVHVHEAEGTRMSKKDILKVMSNLPVRNIDTTKSRYDAISLAAISGTLFEQATKSLIVASSRLPPYQQVLAEIDNIANIISEWIIDNKEHRKKNIQDPDAEIMARQVMDQVAELVMSFRGLLDSHLSTQYLYTWEIKKQTDNIASPLDLLLHLPKTVLPDEVYEMCRKIALATKSSTGELRHSPTRCFPPRRDIEDIMDTHAKRADSEIFRFAVRGSFKPAEYPSPFASEPGEASTGICYSLSETN